VAILLGEVKCAHTGPNSFPLMPLSTGKPALLRCAPKAPPNAPPPPEHAAIQQSLAECCIHGHVRKVVT
jgi:hypothetical protein